MKEILFALIIICAISVLFFTKFGKRLRLRVSGTADEMVSRDASTPEGAKAYYNTAISKKEEDYQKAYSIYTQMLGKIQTYEEQLRSLQKEDMQLNLNINSCIDKNDDNGAKVYLKRQQEVSNKVDIIKNALKELRENSLLQKETVDNIFAELGDLKSEKENAILMLETAQVTKALQATSGTFTREEDKMLERVREGVRRTKEEADGNKIAYESSSTVQQQRIDKQMKNEDVDRKLQELKANRKR